MQEKCTQIDTNELEIICHCRKSLLYNKNEAWIKKNDNEDFDVTMGSYGGAEVCEIVGLFILNTLTKTIDKKHLGIYRDDGILISKYQSGHQNDKFRKELIKIFKQHHLKIEIKCNMNTVDYLDITFNLTEGTYKPYNKMNINPRYINSNSNHPPAIIKQLANSVSRRIPTNSCNEQVFNSDSQYYNNI